MNRTKEKTLVDALEKIWRLGGDSHLTKEYFKSVKTSTDYVNSVMGLSPIQSYIVAVLMDEGDVLSVRNIGRFAKVANIRMMTYETEFKDLLKRQIIKRGFSFDPDGRHKGYEMNPDAVECIRNNTAFVPRPYSEYSSHEVLSKIGDWLRECDQENSYYPMIVKDIRELLQATQQTTFSSRLSAFTLKDEELVLFLLAAYLQVILRHRGVCRNDYDDILTGAGISIMTSLVRSINEGTNDLVKLGLLECDTDDGMAMPNHFRLQDKACSTILEDFNYSQDGCEKVQKDLKQPESFDAKTLFYNEREGKEISKLTELLSKEQFCGVQKRMHEAGMRPGFACLFYGAPGTGKTETVQQLSRLTGRPIFQIDVSELRSKWVGESEKNVQAIFSQYDQMCSHSPITPILLFNEADAILGKRMEGASGSVDKMENTVQNILLQGFEKQRGIIICTTNLTKNLDPAFERRFLYKVLFEKPGEEVKAKIWKSMIPDLNEPDALELARCYDFSGGQIENIARKQTVDHILYNTPVSLGTLKDLCDAENIAHTSIPQRKPIGFCI